MYSTASVAAWLQSKGWVKHASATDINRWFHPQRYPWLMRLVDAQSLQHCDDEQDEVNVAVAGGGLLSSNVSVGLGS